MKKIISTVLLAALCTGLVQAQYKVKPALGKKTEVKPGLVYCLPQNVFKVEVEVEKTLQEKGIYGDYAQQLLKLPAIKQDGVYYKLTGFKIHTVALPDPGQTYSVEGNNLPDLSLTPDGILLGVNLPREAEHRKPEPFEHHRPGDCPEKPSPFGHCRPGEHPQKPEDASVSLPHRNRFAPVAEINAGKKFDTLITRRQTDSGMIVEKVLRPRIDEKTLFEQARKMADQILEIQKAQSALLKGDNEVPYPESTLQFMYGELCNKEQQLMECFTGTVSTEKEKYTFYVNPQTGVLQYSLAYFSPQEGIDETDTARQPETLLLDIALLPSMQAAARPEQCAEAPAADTKNTKRSSAEPAPKKGFVCRVPQKVRVQLVLNGTVLESKDTHIAQWGGLQQLPLIENSCLELDRKTGSVKQFRKL